MAGDAEDAGAAIAVERLDDDVAVLLAEGGDLGCGRAVMSVGGIELGELGDEAAFPARCARSTGSLTTSVFGWMRSRRWVVVM